MKNNPDKVIVWGVGKGYWKLHNLLKFHESIGDIKIIAYVSKYKETKYINGFEVFEPWEFQKKNLNYQYILVTTDNFYKEIIKEYGEKLHIDRKKFLKASVLNIPFFNWKKYIKIYNSGLSIISEVCFGGILSNHLGLALNSPFVNVRIGTKKNDFFEFLKNMNKYMLESPSLECSKYNETNSWCGEEFGRIEYPLLQYDNIMLHGFHYKTQNDFFEDWEKRRKRYNFQNNIVFKILYDEKDIEEFEKIPFTYKLGFYYKETEYNNIISIPFDEVQNAYFWMTYINYITISGEIFNYVDFFELLSDSVLDM